MEVLCGSVVQLATSTMAMANGNMAASEESDFLGSWEEMADSGVLDRQIAQMQAALTTSQDNHLRCPETKPVVIFQEEEGRTRYNPTEPTVKILKRPTNGTDSLLLNGDSNKTPKVPVKSLQQREQEYAEARLRILGEARSPEEEVTSSEDKTMKIQKVQKIDILRSQDNDTILRHPRGPDGTRGFTLQR